MSALLAANSIIPDVSRQPLIHNPFPQLSRVAVAPFFNQSDEKTVDGRQFAMAYYAELQAVPGFEVVPLGVVEEAIIRNHINLSSPAEARRLAQVLNVDAVVIGAITDYSPYYPPRCGLRVEWYAANPGYHEIPPGYGLPWGTPQEEYIPAPLVFEAEMALARAQLATQSPACDGPPSAQPGQLMPVPGTGEPNFDPRAERQCTTDRHEQEARRDSSLSPSRASPRSKKNIRIVSNEEDAGVANTASGDDDPNTADADPRQRCRRACHQPLCRERREFPVHLALPVLSLQAVLCRRIGPTNADSFRPVQALCARRASRITVRL